MARKLFKGIGALLIVGILLGGCATPTLKQIAVDPSLSAAEARKQQELALIDSMNYEIRVFSAGSRIAVAARTDCDENLKPVMGVVFAGPMSFEEEYRTLAVSALDLKGAAQVLHVVPGLPAAQAGLQKGDVFLEFGGISLPPNKDPNELLQKKLEVAKHRQEPVDMKVRRGTRDLAFSVQPALACDHPVLLSNDDAVNAFADGEKIYINKGLVKFADNDDEFAMVVAHEFAHNLLEHRSSKVQNQIVGTVGGLVLDVLAAAAGVNTQGAFTEAGADAGAQAYSQEFESEADYLGLYILARAGYDIDRAPDFFRRLGRVNPTSIVYARSHPTTAHRAVALTQAAQEIKRKQLAGLPLLPDAAGDSADAPVAVAQSVPAETVTTTAALATPSPADALVGTDTQEWQAAGDSDGCEKPWSLSLSRAGDGVTGKLIRDEIAYELSGLVDPATHQVANGQAARASGSTSKLGPRWLGFDVNLSEGDQQGRFWVASDGQRRCETEITLNPSR